jgi:hypothetical protein
MTWTSNWFVLNIWAPRSCYDNRRDKNARKQWLAGEGQDLCNENFYAVHISWDLENNLQITFMKC